MLYNFLIYPKFSYFFEKQTQGITFYLNSDKHRLQNYIFNQLNFSWFFLKTWKTVRKNITTCQLRIECSNCLRLTKRQENTIKWAAQRAPHVLFLDCTTHFGLVCILAELAFITFVILIRNKHTISSCLLMHFLWLQKCDRARSLW